MTAILARGRWVNMQRVASLFVISVELISMEQVKFHWHQRSHIFITACNPGCAFGTCMLWESASYWLLLYQSNDTADFQLAKGILRGWCDVMHWYCWFLFEITYPWEMSHLVGINQYQAFVFLEEFILVKSQFISAIWKQWWQPCISQHADVMLGWF